MGVHSAKALRQEEIQAASIRALAKSSKRKSDMLVEQNAMALFGRAEMAGLWETLEFFKTLGETHFLCAKEQARQLLEEEGCENIEHAPILGASIGASNVNGSGGPSSSQPGAFVDENSVSVKHGGRRLSYTLIRQ